MISSLGTRPFKEVSLRARDVSGQKRVAVDGVPLDSTVGELTQALVERMALPKHDTDGRLLNYHVRLEREGRHLHASETVGNVIAPDDDIVLQPQIMAGMARSSPRRMDPCTVPCLAEW